MKLQSARIHASSKVKGRIEILRNSPGNPEGIARELNGIRIIRDGESRRQKNSAVPRPPAGERLAGAQQPQQPSLSAVASISIGIDNSESRRSLQLNHRG